MATKIAIMNNKGGVLKTTLSTNLASLMAKKGKKVLLVDTDPQGNVTTTFGLNSSTLKYTLAEVVLEKEDVNKAILKEVVPGLSLDILSTNRSLNHFGPSIYSGKVKYDQPNDIFKDIFKKLDKEYDYIIFDTAPYMDLVSINVMQCIDKIIIPMKMEVYAAKSLIDFINDSTAAGVKDKIAFIVPTVFVARTNLHKEVLEQITKIAAKNQIKVTNTKVTSSIQAAAAIGYQRMPLVLTASKSKQVRQYHNILKELEGGK